MNKHRNGENEWPEQEGKYDFSGTRYEQPCNAEVTIIADILAGQTVFSALDGSTLVGENVYKGRWQGPK